MSTSAPQQIVANPRPIVNPDTECWIKNAVRTAVNMALAAHKHNITSSSDVIFKSLIEGICNGTAEEMIFLVGMQPGYVNITRPYSERY